MPPRELEAVGLYTLTRSTRSQQSTTASQSHKPGKFKPLSRSDIAIPKAVADYAPATPKTSRIHIPDEAQIYQDSMSSPRSSNGSPPTSSADIPPTLFKTAVQKEIEAKPLKNIENGERDNTSRVGKSAKEQSESPDSKRARAWEIENMGINRRGKKKVQRKSTMKMDKSQSFSSRISSTSANIYVPDMTMASKKEKASSKSETPTEPKAKKALNLPSPVRPRRSPQKGLRIPGEISLPTPETTQTSPSPKNKRRSIDEEDLIHSAKKSKKDSGISFGSHSPLSSTSADVGQPEVNTECQFCFRQVDRTLAEMYTWPSRRPTMYHKGLYCNWHQTKEAEQEWEQKGYPSIDWTSLEERLDVYNSDLERLINEPETSHYRQELKDKTKGKVQSLARIKKDGDAGLELGFYGYRGLDMMTHHITVNFSDLLRSKSVGDHVMSTNARGATSYARLVLTKELATLLIRDEMGMSIEQAREILKESAAVGEILNGKDVQDQIGPVKKRATGRRYVDENDESDEDVGQTQC